MYCFGCTDTRMFDGAMSQILQAGLHWKMQTEVQKKRREKNPQVINCWGINYCIYSNLGQQLQDCVHVSVHVSAYVCVHACVCVCMCMCVSIHVCVSVHAHHSFVSFCCVNVQKWQLQDNREWADQSTAGCWTHTRRACTDAAKGVCHCHYTCVCGSHRALRQEVGEQLWFWLVQ